MRHGISPVRFRPLLTAATIDSALRRRRNQHRGNFDQQYLCVWVHFPAMCAHMYVHLHVDACVTCMFMHICMCRKVFMCVYTCRRMFPFIHAYMYSCASTRVNVYFFVDLLENAYLSAHV